MSVKLLSIVVVSFILSVSCGQKSDDNEKEVGDDYIFDEDSDFSESPDDGFQKILSLNFTVPDEENEIISSGGSNHFAFPDVARLKNGRFMTVYRIGSGHAEKSGRILSQFSSDGVNWEDFNYAINDNTIDDRDPSLTLLSDGRVILSWFKYRYPDDYSEPWIHRIFFAVSDDNGLTFGNPVQVDPGEFDYSAVAEMNDDGIWIDSRDGEEIKVYAASSRVVETEYGLIIPAYGGNALNWQNMSKTPKSGIFFFVSKDNGKTWEMERVNAEVAQNVWLQEPALHIVDENRWILQVRTAVGTSPGNRGELMQSISDDGGKSWSPYEKLGLVAHAPEIIRLNNGALISSFRWLDWENTIKRQAVSMIYSLDKGDTWSNVVEIRDCGLPECGYPGMVEIEDNKIVVVYYTPGGLGIASKIISFTEIY
jgi:sialidase-1